MNIYYNPLDRSCKSITGGIKQNENLMIKVFGEVVGKDTEPCFFVLRKDEGEAQYLHMDTTYDGWQIRLELKDPGLYFYHFKFGEKHAGFGKFRNLEFSEHFSEYQILVYSEDFTTPDWFKGGTMYQIFPDRFFRAGDVTVGEGKRLHENWNDAPEFRPNEQGKVLNNDFFGGNLRGIVAKLDYLQSLHVTVLYLNPIFKAFSNHRYDTGDYLEIDPMLGTEEDFAYLVEECKKRGIRIMLDGVFNHTGDDSRYFNKYGNYDEVGAYQSKNSKYYAWYTFKQFPEKYSSWWGIDTLPAVNEFCPTYIDFITGKGGVLQYWMKYDIGGYRLDVADELPDEFVEKIRTAVKEKNPNAVVLGEVWEDASNKIAYSRRRKYFQGKELDSVMNYPIKDAIINFLTCNDATMLRNTIAMLRDNYPKCVLDSLMNILGTHDTVRILTALGGVYVYDKEAMSRTKLSDEQREKAKDLLKAASVLLFTLFGVPCIYYGDEIGMEGYSDPFCRYPFAWDNMDVELLEHYRRLAKIRSKLSVFKDSEYRELCSDPNCLVFERRKGKEVAVIYVNRGYNKFDVQFSGTMYDLLDGSRHRGKYTIRPMSCSIISNYKVI